MLFEGGLEVGIGRRFEEESTDERLTALAETVINVEAEAGAEEEEEETSR